MRPVDVVNIPLIKNMHTCIKTKFTGNDGIIFSNQDKIIYNEMILKDKNKKREEKKPEEVAQDFSHQQILDIVKEIKNLKADENNKQEKDIFDVIEDVKNNQ
jgi:histone acetyltransferase (RNA polymerase elongator complex component)